MYKETDCINSVKAYDSSERTLLLVNKHSELLKDKITVAKDVLDTNFQFLNKKMIYLTSNATVFDGQKIENLSFLKASEDLDSSSILLLGDFKLEYPNIFNFLFKLDMELMSITKLFQIKNLYCSLRKKDFFFFSDKSTIILYNLQQTKQKWNFDLSSLGTYQNDINESHPFTLKQFVGIWNNLLLVQLNGYSLLALDVNSGELVKHIPLKTTLDLRQGQYLIDEPDMHLVNDSIIWLSNQHLIHINLNDWEIQTKAINLNLPREQEWRCFKNTYFDGLLYFVADYGWQYVTPSWIGVMNAQTGEVLWKQQLEKTGGLPEAPQVNEKNLYIRTAKGDLHIFEREVS